MNIVHCRDSKTLIIEVEDIYKDDFEDLISALLSKDIGLCYNTVRVQEKNYDYIGAPTGKRN